MLWYAGPLLFSGYAISKHSAEQYVYLKAERLEHLFKQGYSEDAEMTFEVYARGWLERQTKYAPGTIAFYRRSLETVFPVWGGWAPISIILRSTPPQPPARCAVFHLRSLPARTFAHISLLSIAAAAFATRHPKLARCRKLASRCA